MPPFPSRFNTSPQLRADVTFLAAHRIMDYSLLLGVHNRQYRVLPSALTTAGASAKSAAGRAPPNHRGSQGGMAAVMVEGPAVYFLGVIDILQTFTWRKRLEYWLKRYVLRSGVGISCVPPMLYKQRFVANVVDTFIEPPREPPAPTVIVVPKARRAGTAAQIAEVELVSPRTAPRTAQAAAYDGATSTAGGGRASHAPLRTEPVAWYAEIASWFGPIVPAAHVHAHEGRV
jgi:hypothetical protein